MNNKVLLNKLPEGVDPYKYLSTVSYINSEIAQQINEGMTSLGYDLNVLTGKSLVILTADDKEAIEILNNASIIKELGYTEVASLSMSISIFKDRTIARIRECLENGIDIVSPEGLFIIELFKKDSAYDEWLRSAVKKAEKNSECKNQDDSKKEYNKENTIANLKDQEDILVREKILESFKQILDLNQDNLDLRILISSINANLNDIIADDNKKYKEIGIRHLVAKALDMTDITQELKEQLLSVFPDYSEEKGRGQR